MDGRLPPGFKWDPPEEIAPPLPCDRCMNYKVSYRRCRMGFGIECTAVDASNTPIICGRNAWSSGKPKLCEVSRVNVRTVNAYCLEWDHLRYTFRGQIWKCCQCHQDGQYEETCQMCGHSCCRQCTQGSRPRAWLRQLPVNDVPLPLIQRPARNLSTTGVAHQFPHLQRRDAGPTCTDAASRRPNIQGGAGPLFSGAAYQPPTMQGQGAVPLFPNPADHIRGLGGDSGPSFSGPADEFRSILDRGALLSFPGVAHQLRGIVGGGGSFSSGAAPQLRNIQVDVGPASSGATFQPPNTQGGVGPASFGAAYQAPNIQGRDPGPSFSGIARQPHSSQGPGPSSSRADHQSLANQIRVPWSTSVNVPTASPHFHRQGSAPSPSGASSQPPSSQVRLPASKCGGGRRSSLSSRGGVSSSVPFGSTRRSHDTDRRISGSAPTSSGITHRSEDSRNPSSPTGRRRHRKQPSPRKASDSS